MENFKFVSLFLFSQEAIKLQESTSLLQEQLEKSEQSSTHSLLSEYK